MPRGDQTGPMGAGPMTGRAAGYCAGFPVPGFMNRQVSGWGRGGGRGFGRGRGMGWGRGFGYAPPSVPFTPAASDAPASELNALRSQADGLKQTLEDIDARIAAIEKERQ